jgi:hypothetical protein
MTRMQKRVSLLWTGLVLSVWTVFLTGCGGGGGGSNPLSPVVPTTIPTTNPQLSSIDGYVSKASLSKSIRAAVGSTLKQPFVDATIELLAFDEKGVEHILDTKKSDAKGYYQFLNVTNPHLKKNLIVRAGGSGLRYEALIPEMKLGTKVQAPTMDQDTGIQADIIREAAKQQKHAIVNVAELLAILSPAACRTLKEKNKIGDVVKSFLIREESRTKRLGASKTALDSFALELQQKVNEMIEKGELAPADAWKTFSDMMTAKAKELGIKVEDQKVMDDIDQTIIIEPIYQDLKGDPFFKDEYLKMEFQRVKERKLKSLSLLTDSVKVLFNQGTAPEYLAFLPLSEALRQSFEKAQNIDELHSVLFVVLPDQRKFLEYLSLAILKAGFKPEWVSKVFAIQPPEYGFGFAQGLTNTRGYAASVLPLAQVVQSTPGSAPSSAETFLIEQEKRLEGLYAKIKDIANSAGLKPLPTPELIKAIAYIIWAGSPENLNFPPPPNVTPTPTEFVLTGKVETTTVSKIINTVTYTHVLTAGDWTSRPVFTKAQTQSAMVTNDFTLAFLAASPTFPITYADGTKATGSLDELTKHQMVEITGLLTKTPLILNLPADGGATTVKVSIRSSQSRLVAQVADTNVSSSASSGSSSDSSGVIYTSAENPEPYYLLVKSAHVYPPPPPPPIELVEERGLVRQAQTLAGQSIPGVFYFESANPIFHGALLEPTFGVVEPQAGTTSSSAAGTIEPALPLIDQLKKVQLVQWVGKTVLINGIMYSESAESSGQPSKQIIYVHEVKGLK